jgi:phosphoenolpyruvate synthase/pyruvate phosphate dikinase
VKLTVGPQDFTVEAADPATANAHWEAMRPARAFTPNVDTTERGLVDVCSLGADDVRYAGAKAAQLGEVCSLGPSVTTPGGFVIPFHHYVAHLATNHIDSGIAQMIADGAFQSDAAARAQRLGELRRIFERLPVDRALVRQVQARLRQLPRGRVIFRSSTNAEDLVGFNGAGLYESVVIGPSLTDAEVERAIREVWGSVWTQRGFEERDFYRIDHTRVAMAILVQPFVADVVANGVAITQNPFNADRPGVFINVQTSRGSVTAAGDAVPEQHLVYTYNAAPEPEVLSRSSLMNGQAILDEQAVLRLTDVLQRLHQRLAPRYPRPANAVDVELLVTRTGQIVIVQARPYTVVWTTPPRYAAR